jgi:putative flippase GtrA
VFRSQFLIFVFVGGISAVCHFAVLVALHEVMHVPLVPATTVGALCGAVVNYWLNRVYTFARSRPARHAYSRFGLVAFGGLAINALSMAALEHLVPGVPYLIRQCIVTAAVLVYSYLANKHWTFRNVAVTPPS